ncbi:MAG: LssY C-terminal domain-containing protein [Paracoccaceae bacterium]
MPHSLDQILPSLQSLGVWAYWVLALGAMFEAIVFTGIVIPGSLMVIAGGLLVNTGSIDFLDLIWFAAGGAILGAEISFRLGRASARGLSARTDLGQTGYAKRSQELLKRYGGFAMVIGRFFGPLSAFVPFSAAMAGMSHRYFTRWNVISAVPYALILPALGYFFGDALKAFGPMATRVLIFGLAALAVLAILWFIVVRIERTLPYLLSVLRSLLHGFADLPPVAAFASRHPRLAAFVGGRFDSSRFTGLTATLLALVFCYVFAVYLGSVLNFILSDPVVQTDNRLATLLFALRDARLVRVFAYVTALGDWQVVATLAVGIGAALVIRRRRALALGMAVSVLGDAASVALLKLIFHRPRPELAYFIETSGSFPSGHAAVSVAFYGALAYIGWRERLIGPMAAALLAVSLAFVVGLSRVYLIEHYLSDVLNGYLVGAMWLVIGIAVAEWRQCAVDGNAPPRTTPGRLAAALAAAVAIASGLTSGWMVARFDQARNLQVSQAEITTVTDLSTLFDGKNAPAFAESIMGMRTVPISLVVVTPDPSVLEQAMTNAGWTEAPKPGLATLARLTGLALSGEPAATVPATPYFWKGRPHDLAFREPGDVASGAKSHHARFWATRFRTAAGQAIMVGTASFDDGLKWGAPHRLNPDIDAERDRVVGALESGQAVAGTSRFQIVEPSPRHPGASWFTDGKAVILTLRGASG